MGVMFLLALVVGVGFVPWWLWRAAKATRDAVGRARATPPTRPYTDEEIAEIRAEESAKVGAREAAHRRRLAGVYEPGEVD